MQEILTNNKFFFKEIILLDVIVFLFVLISHLIVIRLFFNELNPKVSLKDPVIASKIYFSHVIKKNTEKKILVQNKPNFKKITEKKPKKKNITKKPEIKKLVNKAKMPEEPLIDENEFFEEEIANKEEILENDKQNDTFIENSIQKIQNGIPVEIAQVNYFDKKKCSPSYPRVSIKRGEKGKVLVSVIINEDGFVDLVELIKSSGFKRLDDAALKAAKNCRFIAAKRGGVTVKSKAKVPYNFVY